MAIVRAVEVRNRKAARRPSKVGERWVVRSLVANALASTGDYAVLLTCAKVLGLPSSVCALLGLSVGMTGSFLLNRSFAFPHNAASLGGALARYVAVIGCLMSLHAAAVGLLTDRLGMPIVAAKLLCDAILLAGGQLLLLRYVVFPRNKDARAAVGAKRAVEPA
jgi:putative flippase GtrA